MNRLELTGVSASYGSVRALEDISLSVAQGETVALLGTNGNGKSTVMRCVMGMVRPSAGSISACIGDTTLDLTRMTTEEIVASGITLVPEGRRLFAGLSVEENLYLGATRVAARANLQKNLSHCFELFPVLRERRKQSAGSMSGGEQQMVALARALMSEPHILLIDEPSVGLAPVIVKRTIDKIKEMKDRNNLTVLMAEQNFTNAIRVADRGYVIVHGSLAFEGRTPEELSNNDLIRKFYMGL